MNRNEQGRLIFEEINRALASKTDVPANFLAARILEIVLPQITKPEQLAGIPELSLLTTETRPVATIYQWRDGKLYEDTDSEDYEYFPHMVIADEGPLTVVWRP